MDEDEIVCPECESDNVVEHVAGCFECLDCEHEFDVIDQS